MNHYKLIYLFTLILFSTTFGERPNFLFILVDDLGKMDIGIEGSSFYETPNIDAFAKSGMRFTHGYATCQVCSPSRASILTGTYPARHGITDWIGAKTGKNWRRNDRVVPVEYQHNLPHEDTTLAEAMLSAGYKTFFAGKWHLGSEGSYPEDHGFQINKGGREHGGPGKGGFFSPYMNPKLKDGPDGEALSMRLAQETCDFIEENRNNQFFAYLSFYLVHAPMQTTQELWLKYRNKAEKRGLAESRYKFDRTKAVRQVQDNPIYGGMMEQLDDAVGLVLNKLKELKLDNNTVVIFTSDNGGVSSGDAFATSLLPYRGGKGRQWEGGIRVPFYIHAPGITNPGSICDTPVISTDFYPTILKLAGIPLKKEQHKDGVNISPLLAGKTINNRDLFWHYPHYGNQGGEPSSIIRSGNWKLIFYHEDKRYELYKIDQDIGEQNNLSKSNPEKVKQMKLKLDTWLKHTKAKIPLPNQEFDQDLKEKQLFKAANDGLQRMEKWYRDCQKATWTPNTDWWGSKPIKK